jgi:hypothetical protein
MATESEDNMKVKNYKNIKDYIKKKKDNLKGITICIAKKCNEALYHNQSTSNPKYCMRCGG